MALYFDGIDDKIVIPNIPIGVSHTISFWFNPDVASYVYGAIFAQDDVAGLWYNAINKQMDYFFGGDNLNTTIFTTNQWHHFVVSSLNSVITFYTDGHADGGFTPAGIGYTATNIGTDPSLEAYQGYLEDMRIYNRALTASEVQKLYLSKLKNNDLNNGLIAYWPMDDGSNGTNANNKVVLDRSNNRNNGAGTFGANAIGLTYNSNGTMTYKNGLFS